jgi:hypothetical protein
MISMFRRNILLQSSEQPLKIETTGYLFPKLHGVTLERTVIFIDFAFQNLKCHTPYYSHRENVVCSQTPVGG